MTYTIGEVSKRIGLTISQLRFYDKEGLMPYIKRNASGIRQFEESDLQWLNIITCLKDSGVAIKKIRQFVDWAIEGDSTIEQRLNFMKEQKENLLCQMTELKKHIKTVENKIWYYETAAEAGTTAIHDHSNRRSINVN